MWTSKCRRRRWRSSGCSPRTTFCDRTVVTSRASYQLRRLRALAPELRLGLSKGSSPPRGPHGVPEWAALLSQRGLLPRVLPDILRRARADAAYLQYRLVTPPLIAALHRTGYRLLRLDGG